MNIPGLFYSVDEFCQQIQTASGEQLLLGEGQKRRKKCKLSMSKVMTIIILFHQSDYRTFKHFYSYLHIAGSRAFPELPSYNRFVELMPRALLPLVGYLISRRGKCSGINYVDSTSIAVCKNKRISRNRVFKDLAALGKSSMGWFFGFKLHIIINDIGELLAFTLSPANVDDRKELAKMSKGLWGKLYGDKGYISEKLFRQLFENGLELITNIRQNMKNALLPIQDKILLRKCSLIETVNDQLKNISQIEHSRHRNPINFLINLLGGLIAYSRQTKKPSLNLCKNLPLTSN